MPRLRLGVAFLVPPPVATEIDGLRRACGDDGLERVPPHLTLVPPVNVNVDDLGRALARLRAAAASAKGPIDLGLGPVTTFAPDTPVLYLAVTGAPESMTALHTVRDRVFRPPLARTLTWPFVPHVTVAEEMDLDRIAAALTAMADYRVGTTFTHVTLLREGAPERVWAPIADARLGPPAVVARGGLPVELWWSSLADPEVTEVLGPMDVAPGGEPFVLTARRDDVVLGAVRGAVRNGVREVDRLVVTDAAGQEDIERHLLGAVAVSVR